jgi:hypothetical protein
MFETQGDIAASFAGRSEGGSGMVRATEAKPIASAVSGKIREKSSGARRVCDRGE